MDIIVFKLDEQYYGLPAASVHQVLEPVLVTRLPFTPDFVDGLINVSGRVVLQMDLGKRLGLARPDAGSRKCLLLVDLEDSWCAFQVDKVVARALDVDVRQHEAADGFVAGELMWHDSAVLVLAQDALGLDKVTAVGVPESGEALWGAAEAAAADSAGHSVHSYLRMIVGGESYALPLDQAKEVVETEAFMQLPHAPPEVAGMMILRGAPLLAVRLQVLLGGEKSDAACPFLVIVERSGARIGLLVDRIVGIEHHADEAVQATDEPDAALKGYLLGGGGELIGLLQIDGVVTEQHVARYGGLLAKRMVEQVRLVAEDELKRMLLFRLDQELFALPLELVVRVEEAQAITRLPATGATQISGMVQCQGDVLPLVDMRLALGFAAREDAQGIYVITRVGDSQWALWVDAVERLVNLQARDIEPTKASGFFAAVGKLENRLLSVLTLEPLLAN
ncbi:MAG: hypothetical protein EPN21_14345 [Methylococcaceae bacterium]|nr:MAG: hypothetical protein EPN21_14345 [Methylococcaceae bacterium]